MDADFSDLSKLAADLGNVPDVAPKLLAKALGVTANKVKLDARKAVRSRKHFKQAGSAIDYDLAGSSGAVSEMSADIGYDKSNPSGKLGNLLEYGAPNAPRMMRVKSKGGGWITVPVPGGGIRPLAPGGELQTALKANQDDFVAGLSAAVDDSLRRAGL